MLETEIFGLELKKLGFNTYSGVPCSYLAPLINYAINEDALIMANNEGDAIAIATGISLVQRNNNHFGVALMQNSGLSNALSPLTSLNDTFKIPILGFVSLRGERNDLGQNTDEPQHELLGIITDQLLQTCQIPYAFLNTDMDEAKKQLLTAKEHLKQGKSFFFIVKDKTFQKVPLKTTIQPINNLKYQNSFEPITPLNMPTRLEALKSIHNLAQNKAVLLATTGKTGRELYEINDTTNQLYMVGSMGCVGALGLGISLASTKKVISIDGDSALLMRLGALSTNAYYAKKHNQGNFCHIILDNACHDSTGGQFSLSPHVNFPQIASSCGYEHVHIACNIDDLEQYLSQFLNLSEGGASFIYLKILQGSKQNLGRPKITPNQVAQRLSAWINDTQ